MDETVLSRQEIFNKVYRHLLTQNAMAKDNERCMYRSPEGLRCAVGCLLTDGEAVECDSELAGVTGLYKKGVLPKRLIDSMELLSHLQLVHDAYPVAGWEGRLRTVAFNFGLSVPEL